MKQPLVSVLIPAIGAAIHLAASADPVTAGEQISLPNESSEGVLLQLLQKIPMATIAGLVNDPSAFAAEMNLAPLTTTRIETKEGQHYFFDEKIRILGRTDLERKLFGGLTVKYDYGFDIQGQLARSRLEIDGIDMVACVRLDSVKHLLPSGRLYVARKPSTHVLPSAGSQWIIGWTQRIEANTIFFGFTTLPNSPPEADCLASVYVGRRALKD